MNQFLIKKQYNPFDTVRLCKKDICIEAKGENGKLLVNVVAAAILCFSIAAIIKAVK